MNKKFFTLLTIFIFTFSLINAQDKYKEITVTQADFFWNKFITSENDTTKPDLTVTIPSDWNKYEIPQAKEFLKKGKGSGTYKIKLDNLIPNTEYSFETYDLGYTAFNIVSDGKIVFSCGDAQEDFNNSKAEQKMDFATFKSDKNGNATFFINVSNNMYRKGGLRGDLKIQESTAAHENFLKRVNLFSVLSGILLTIVLYSLLIFILTKDKTNLFLSLFVLLLFSRIVTNAFPILKYYFPGIPYSVMLKIEYLAVFLAPAIYTLYLNQLNKNIFIKFNHIYICIPSFVLLFLDIVLPIRLANRLVPYMQYYMFAVILIDLIFALIQVFKHKDIISLLALLSFLIIGFGAGINILSIKHVSFLNGVAILSISFVFYALFQIILLAYLQNKNLLRMEKLNEDLVETNKSYYRFVPREFLDLLSKKDITEVTLGEKKEAKMAILSADIRNFTSISETMTEKQVFDMLNRYLNVIAPIIRKHNGIIEKYLGDGIIAIFLSGAEDALLCSLEMQEAMIQLRKDFISLDLPQIKIGVGIHYGNVIIGTGGDKERMTEISLSNDIDIAIKSEAATKKYKVPIIATSSVLKEAATEAKKQNRKFNFYGKQLSNENIKLFSIYNEKTGTVL